VVIIPRCVRIFNVLALKRKKKNEKSIVLVANLKRFLTNYVCKTPISQYNI